MSFTTKNGIKTFNAKKTKNVRGGGVLTQSKLGIEPEGEPLVATDDGLSDNDVTLETKSTKNWSAKRSGYSDDKRSILTKIKYVTVRK